MKILVIAPGPPRPNQTAGELRLFSLLNILASKHTVDFHLEDNSSAENLVSAENSLIEIGVRLVRSNIDMILRNSLYDIVLFEFYFVAVDLIDNVRAWQPSTKIVVDSVDVHFHRLRSKARLTKLTGDVAEAEQVRKAELDIYQRVDLVVVVSTDDQRILEAEGLRTAIEVVPLIHTMLPMRPHRWSDRLELIFIGSYKWSPNIDAMVYFCSEILPKLRQQVPRLRLRIVGSSPTREILELASSDIEIVGFVESTADYLLSSDISVAPLRFGGGVKGKIAEAIAHGLPVVTTSIGAEGFGFRNGHDVMVADTAAEFCDAIVNLWSNKALYERIRRNGWERVREFCSTETVERLLPGVLRRTQAASSKQISKFRRMKIIFPHYFDKYVAWRFVR